jgi:hypothetical protein
MEVMGYRRPIGNIIPERLAAWYLFKPRTFEITLENLAEIMHALDQPVRLGSSYYNPSDKRKKVDELLVYLNKIVKMKEAGLVVEPPAQEEKEVGSA